MPPGRVGSLAKIQGESKAMPIIRIDLGTSNSTAAVLRGGRPLIIPSAEG
jgi:molecular chaperone DnaK